MSKLLLLVLFAALGAGTLLTYTNAEKHYTIKYPSEWTKSEQKGYVAFLSPLDSASDDFRENVNVMVQDLSANPVDLDQYTSITKSQIEGMEGSSIISIKDKMVGGLKGKEVNYNLKYNGRLLRLKAYYTIKGKEAYLLTFTALPESYSRYELVGKDVMDSFVFDR